MCGFAGYVDFDNLAPRGELLRAMTALLRHRGPDAEGYQVIGPCGLAHARLKVIDLTGSDQPMHVPGSGLYLAYNGELYNFRELRRRLLAEGSDFISVGDTEVLLRWLDRRWYAGLDDFDGMFAFAAWDRARRRLLLARDPFGKKPLVYARPRPNLIVFASEIKAVLRHPEVAAELNEAGLRQVLRFRAVYGEQTLYSGVFQVAPGSWLEFSEHGLRTGKYFDLHSRYLAARDEMRHLPRRDVIPATEMRIDNAVRKRLVADVPLGAFLSGGIDSSLVVHTMRRYRDPGDRICTFAVGFSGDTDSELPFAAHVARVLGTRHTEVQVSPTDFVELLPVLSSIRDAPVSEPADVAIAKMSHVARQTVTVVLSGEGADESFAGYPKYAFARLPWPARPLLRAAGPAATARLAGFLGFDRRRVHIAARALAQPDELGSMVQWFSYLGRDQLRALFPALRWSDEDWEQTVVPARNALASAAGLSAASRMQFVDCLTWLPGNLLERGDRMTMAAALEMRCPFMDRLLLPWALALPDRLKRRRHCSKWLLRHLLRATPVATVAQRRKWGFRVPLRQWFCGVLGEMLRAHAQNRASFTRACGGWPALERMIDQHLAGQDDHSMCLWTVLITEAWYQRRDRIAGLGVCSPATMGVSRDAPGSAGVRVVPPKRDASEPE